MSSFSLPHTEQLNGLSSPIQITGTPNDSAQRIEFNLFDANGEYILHYNVRFNEGTCVRNSTKNGQQWQHEERDGGNPFEYGQEFTFELSPDGSHALVCKVNGNEHCVFHTRDASLQDVTSLQINGDLQLTDVSIGDSGNNSKRDVPEPQDGGQGDVVHLDDEPQPEPEQPNEPEPQPQEPEPQQPEPPKPASPQPQPNIVRPPPDHHESAPSDPQSLPDLPPPSQPANQGQLSVPYHCPLQEFSRTHRLRVMGAPSPDAKQFEVIMRLSNGDALLHFNPRLDQNCVFRNATHNMQWQPQWEDKSGNGCPFQPGHRFALDFIANGNVMMCFVDGVEYCKYTVHGDINDVHTLQINGDLQLDQVLIA